MPVHVQLFVFCSAIVVVCCDASQLQVSSTERSNYETPPGDSCCYRWSFEKTPFMATMHVQI
jgi:hypothetical protein